MFEYRLNYTENKVFEERKSVIYHYDILDENAEIGTIVAIHNKNENVVTITMRVKWLDTYTSSGTARRLLHDMMEGIIFHESKAKIKFNQYDMHTVALLELSGISSKIAFN